MTKTEQKKLDASMRVLKRASLTVPRDVSHV
jgi:hypothetical protein